MDKKLKKSALKTHFLYVYLTKGALTLIETAQGKKA